MTRTHVKTNVKLETARIKLQQEHCKLEKLMAETKQEQSADNLKSESTNPNKEISEQARLDLAKRLFEIQNRALADEQSLS